MTVFLNYIDTEGNTHHIQKKGLVIRIDKNENLYKITKLSSNLVKLFLNNNPNLVSLPNNLPSSLSELKINHNPKLTELPILPDKLTELVAIENDLRSLPELPKALRSLWLQRNLNLEGEINLDKLPKLSMLNISETKINLKYEGINVPSNLAILGLNTSIHNLKIAKKLKKDIDSLVVNVQ